MTGVVVKDVDKWLLPRTAEKWPKYVDSQIRDGLLARLWLQRQLKSLGLEESQITYGLCVAEPEKTVETCPIQRLEKKDPEDLGVGFPGVLYVCQLVQP